MHDEDVSTIRNPINESMLVMLLYNILNLPQSRPYKINKSILVCFLKNIFRLPQETLQADSTKLIKVIRMFLKIFFTYHKKTLQAVPSYKKNKKVKYLY